MTRQLAITHQTQLRSSYQNREIPANVRFAPAIDHAKRIKTLMSEQYQKFNPADYIKTDADVRELLKAATDEDTGDGTVIRAVLKRYVSAAHSEPPPTTG